MKRIIAVLLAVVLLAALLTACGGNDGLHPEPLDADEVGIVTASDAIYSDYLYVIEDDVAVAELVELYNGLRYEPTDKVSFSDLLGGTLFQISYQTGVLKSSEYPILASVWISPDGYVYFSDVEGEEDSDAELPVYRLTSSFDEERLREILKKYDANPSFEEMEYTGGN